MKLIFTQISLNGTISSLAWPQIHSNKTKINDYTSVTFNIHISAIHVLTMHFLLLIHPKHRIHVLPTWAADLPLLPKVPSVSSSFVLHLPVKKAVNGMVHCNYVEEAPISCAFHNGTGRLDLHLPQWKLCHATPLIHLHPTTIIAANVLLHNWMSKLDMKSGFYYIPNNLQSHKCYSIYLGNAANVSPDIQWATSLQHP